MRQDYLDLSIAYPIRLVYPNQSAAALQTIQMAAAFADLTSSTRLYVHDLLVSREDLFQKYAIPISTLDIRSMRIHHWPSSIRQNSVLRFALFNTLVNLDLVLQPISQNKDSRRILFTRSRLEATYWGLLRPYLRWMHDWVFVYEAHDLEASDSVALHGRSKRTGKMLRNFDIILALTQSLAQDIVNFSEGNVSPIVVHSCAGLPRCSKPPPVTLDRTPIILGYFGSIDTHHGVEYLIEAMRFLPDYFHLKITGTVNPSARQLHQSTLRDSDLSRKVDFLPHLDYSLVANEMDKCDILLLPGGDNKHSSRYRSPLKLFDYMTRGKPIIAAGVDAHLEILKDGVDALVYHPGNSEHIASKILELERNPEQARVIAHNAWNAAKAFTYEARAKSILDLISQ